MPDTFTERMGIRIRTVGSALPHRFTNNWGLRLNEELELIDRVVGEVCTSDQVHEIARRLRDSGREEGIIL